MGFLAVVDAAVDLIREVDADLSGVRSVMEDTKEDDCTDVYVAQGRFAVSVGGRH